MARLVYAALCSLDGYVADADGGFGWAEPDEEVIAAINGRLADVGTFLHGRRMYELMRGWEEDPSYAAGSPGSAGFAEIWQEAAKVVYSTTLPQAPTQRTRLARSFDPGVVAAFVQEAEQDVTIAGPTLAAQAFRAGIVDDVQLTVAPAVVGGGLRALPADVRLDLVLHDERRFGNGMVGLEYAVVRR